ncbi:synaptosomal-associated protein 23-like isoform X1 [Watersipora subatra]|uniref:synaptosomal-associated protein 23-like isoform X1 n=1 Tax=Watersipora subatra TaxID=2589382 RepID=UPI00355B315C
MPSENGKVPLEDGMEEPEPETEEERAHREVQAQIDSAVNESLESTRRMLQLAGDAQDSGVKTIVALNEQGEQLDRIEEGMDKINTDMKDAEKSLEGLEKCCGLCVLPWKKAKNPQGMNYDASWKDPNDQPTTEGPRPVVGGGMAPTGNMVARITDDAREDEMEENLQQVGSMVSNLRNMAVDMGNEITSQNKAIDNINRKAEALDNRVDNANKRAVNILRKS